MSTICAISRSATKPEVSVHGNAMVCNQTREKKMVQRGSPRCSTRIPSMDKPCHLQGSATTTVALLLVVRCVTPLQSGSVLKRGEKKFCGSKISPLPLHQIPMQQVTGPESQTPYLHFVSTVLVSESKSTCQPLTPMPKTLIG